MKTKRSENNKKYKFGFEKKYIHLLILVYLNFS